MNELKTGYMKQNDFDPKHPDWSRNGQQILKGKNVTTLLDYHNAASLDSDSGKHIDAGRTAYLCNWLAYEDGTWPWVEIEDLDKTVLPKDNISVYHANGRHVLAPDTLVFWR
jgi:hypothetical protein